MHEREKDLVWVIGEAEGGFHVPSVSGKVAVQMLLEKVVLR